MDTLDADTVIEVVRKLIGPITAVGCHDRDKQRLHNLEQMIIVVDKLLSDIGTASIAETRQEASMKAIGKTAGEFLRSL